MKRGGQDRDLFGRTSTKTADWSHRRGEPRWFALWWTVFVLSSAMIAMASAGGPFGGSFESYQPALRLLMLGLGCGVALLWPATRLSQEPPEGGVGGVLGSVLMDLIVVQVPVQAVLLPLVVLARWPLGVVLSLGLNALAWGVLVGALLAAALCRIRWRGKPDGDHAGVWMLVFFAIVLAAPMGEIVVLGAGATGRSLDQPSMVEWWWLMSPATSGLEITRPRPWAGAEVALVPEHVTAAAIVLGTGLAAWSALLIGARVAHRRGRA